MLRLLHLEPKRYEDDLLLKLEKNFSVTCFEPRSQEELNDFVNDERFECIFTRLGISINHEVISKQPNLKFIVSPTTGLNHIDLSLAKEKSIDVISLKGETKFLENVRSTAEHTWAILLSLIRNINDACIDVKLGSWRREPFIADELDGKKIGIIGYGRIGKMIARYASAFNMKVLVHDTDPNIFYDSSTDILPISSPEEIFKESEIISLHIPYSLENIDYVDSKKINLMREGAYIINTSRGELIDEEALLVALSDGKIKGAALDVLQGDSAWEESSDPKNKLVEYAKRNTNLIITPHMAGYGEVSISKTRRFITEKFLRCFSLKCH